MLARYVCLCLWIFVVCVCFEKVFGVVYFVFCGSKYFGNYGSLQCGITGAKCVSTVMLTRYNTVPKPLKNLPILRKSKT